jgi:hypothetical protein
MCRELSHLHTSNPITDMSQLPLLSADFFTAVCCLSLAAQLLRHWITAMLLAVLVGPTVLLILLLDTSDV